MASNAVEALDWLVIEELCTQHSKPVRDAIPTPLPALNACCRGEGGGLGLARGWHAVLAGGSGHGKSLLALNLAAHATTVGGAATAFVSLEMSRPQVVTRFLAIASGADVRRLEPGPGFDRETWREAGEVWVQQRTAPFFLVERPPRSISGLADVMLDLVDNGARFVIVDYLQLVGVAEVESTASRVARVSSVIQELAFRFDVTTLLLSQFNRVQSFNRQAGPVIEGLAGGSSIENDADLVLLLDHSQYTRSLHGAETNLLVAKNRHGPTAKLPVSWDYRSLRLRQRDSLDAVQAHLSRES